MLRKAWKTGIISLALLVLLTAVSFVRLPQVFGMWVSNVRIGQSTKSEWDLRLAIDGANLLRANSFYLDGKRIDDCLVSRVTYDRCDVFVNQELFGNDGGWHKIELGFSKGPLLNLVGDPTWIEWKKPNFL